MKRPQEILLDFTTLLDIMMLILFFFVLFSHLDTERAMGDAEQMRNEASAQMALADSMMDNAARTEREAIARAERAEEAERRYREADSQHAADITAIEAFSEGQNLRLTLLQDDADWALRIQQGDAEPFLLESGNVNAERLTAVLRSEFQCKPTDTQLCVFLYDGSARGSRASYMTVHEALTAMRTDFPHLYVSETDISE